MSTERIMGRWDRLRLSLGGGSVYPGMGVWSGVVVPAGAGGAGGGGGGGLGVGWGEGGGGGWHVLSTGHWNPFLQIMPPAFWYDGSLVVMRQTVDVGC